MLCHFETFLFKVQMPFNSDNCQSETTCISFRNLQGDAGAITGICASQSYIKLIVNIFTSLILQPTEVCLQTFELHHKGELLYMPSPSPNTELSLVLTCLQCVITSSWTFSSVLVSTAPVCGFVFVLSTILILLQVHFPIFCICNPQNP